MAIKRVDEFDQVTEAEIVDFSLDGVDYEIDLSEGSKKMLYSDLEKYIKVARRKTSGPAARKSHKRTTARQPAAEATINNDAIRDWAKSVGMKVSDRGRIPREVMDAFDKAHVPSGAASMFSATGAN